MFLTIKKIFDKSFQIVIKNFRNIVLLTCHLTSIINDSSTRHYTDTTLAQKALVTLAIEHTLLELDGKTLLDKVTEILYKKHMAYLPDCYEHPEYLNEALKKIYGDGYKVVVEKIKIELGEFAYQKQISEFMEKIAV